MFLLLMAIVLAVLYAFPFVLVILNSLKDRVQVIQDPLGWPTEWKWSNFTEAIDKMDFWQALGNSLFITIVSVVLVVITSAGLAYYLQRARTRTANTIFLVLVASMIVPFQALMLPFVSFFGANGLGWSFNQLTLSIFYVGFGVALSTFLYHGFISNIPFDLDEAAAIDGAGPFRTFMTVIFPLLGPVTATVSIINALWIWNDYLLPSIVLDDTSEKTLPLRTFVFFGQYTSDYGLAMAGLLLAMFPIVIFYFIMQRKIIAGISAGAVK
ncbi:carbohydrate ABC transporter permease [Demequina sp.]|uniref:carbohydrate ABC transporter permease n=1 Tax=Demequina sp. TaxID=2050685 RepID=UPI0025EA54E0|nr:carbohydrate ABC transporter permease [Demequina sp.]